MKYVVEINKVRYFLDGNSKRFFIENDKKTPQEWNGLLGKEISQQVEDDLNVLACWSNLPRKTISSIKMFLITIQTELTHISYKEKIKTYTILNDPFKKKSKSLN